MSLKNKISLFVAAFMLMLSVGIFSIVFYIVKENVRENVIHNFAEQQKTIVQSQKLIYDRLVESALLLAQNPAFKANVSLQDEASVYQSIDEFLDLLKVDLICVTNSVGQFISTYPSSFLSNYTNDHSMISNALEGQIPEIELESPVIWLDSTNLYLVVSVPISTNYDIIGSLTLGTAITDYESQELQLSPDVDIHFSYESRVYASTFEDDNSRDKIATIINNQTYESNEKFKEKDELFVSFNPIDQNGKAYLISSTSRSKAMQMLDQISNGMLGLAMASLLLILLSGGVLGHILSAPFVPVIEAFEEVEKGTLSVRLDENKNDEFGKLGIAFNKMVDGLKERIKLRTYVGGHTIEKLSNETIHSQKINAAVLFSDIRGFTAYTQSEKAVEVVNMLNKWLGFQADIIIEYGGSVDKFVGDEVMAIFEGKECTNRAIQCAKKIQSQSKSFVFNDKLGLGIGIHYGSMIMGDIGTQKRKDHTVIGDVVNIASRLCSNAQKGQIWIPSNVIPSDNLDQYQMSLKSLKGIKAPLEIGIIQT